MKYKMTYHHWKHTFDHKWKNALSIYWRLRKGKTEIESTSIYACGFRSGLDHNHDRDHQLHAREGE